MVILHLYDALNGHRYRKFSYDYYLRNVNDASIVEAFIVPGTI